MMTAVVIASFKSEAVCSQGTHIFWWSPRIQTVLQEVSPSEELVQHRLASEKLRQQQVSQLKYIAFLKKHM